jgi:hypothetical protein
LDILADNDDTAAGELVKQIDAEEHSGFSRAGRAANRDNLALLYREIYIAENNIFAEAFFQVAKL